jgi:FkbM family methyltransferase
MLPKFKKYLRSVLLGESPEVEQYKRTIFSQEGEDMILSRIFENQSQGFYVDVGAHHPTRFSNTYYFYLRGWHGINVDAMPGSMAPFHAIRPRDVNLEIAVGEKEGKLTYHIFNDPALNTFDPALAKEREGIKQYRIVETKEIEIRPLAKLLEEHMADKTGIDFLSVDVEGLDLAVLRSNDWTRFSPKYVLAEDSTAETVEQALHSPVAQFLYSVGYVLFAKTVYTQLFRKRTDT